MLYNKFNPIFQSLLQAVHHVLRSCYTGKAASVLSFCLLDVFVFGTVTPSADEKTHSHLILIHASQNTRQ